MSIPVSKMYVISLNFEDRNLRVAALSDDGEAFIDSGNTAGNYLWTNWSNSMSPNELLERVEFALNVGED